MPLKIDSVESASDAHRLLYDVTYYLAKALAAAIQAEAPQMVRRLKSDLKAAEGAIRHAKHRINRAKAGQPMRRRGL